MNQKMFLGAISGLMLAASMVNAEPAKKGPAKEEAKGECHGVNSCKGQGECGGPGHGCSGKNECKGKGWLKKTKIYMKKMMVMGCQFLALVPILLG